MTPKWCDNCGQQTEHLKFGLCPDCFNAPSSYDVRVKASHNSSDTCNCVGTSPSIVKGFLTGAYYWKEGIK